MQFEQQFKVNNFDILKSSFYKKVVPKTKIMKPDQVQIQ